MIFLFFSMLLLCPLVPSETNAIFQSSSKSITLKCSSDGCPRSPGDYKGLYLYHQFFQEEEEVVFINRRTPDIVAERQRYKNRTNTAGSLESLTIIISKLTVYDEGVYSCKYKKSVQEGVTCNVYHVFIADPEQPKQTSPSPDLHPPTPPENVPVAPKEGVCDKLILVLVTCAITMLVTMIFSVLITLKVKKWMKRRVKRAQTSDEYVYEDMRNHRHPPQN